MTIVELIALTPLLEVSYMTAEIAGRLGP